MYATIEFAIQFHGRSGSNMDSGTLPMEGGSKTRCLRNVAGSHIVMTILAYIVIAKEYIYSLLMISVDRLATL
jgi:hypothetical protein